MKDGMVKAPSYGSHMAHVPLCSNTNGIPLHRGDELRHQETILASRTRTGRHPPIGGNPKAVTPYEGAPKLCILATLSSGVATSWTKGLTAPRLGIFYGLSKQPKINQQSLSLPIMHRANAQRSLLGLADFQ